MKRYKRSTKIILSILTAILFAFGICAFGRSDYSSAAYALTTGITFSERLLLVRMDKKQ